MVLRDHPLNFIEQTPPDSAVGHVRRIVDGVVDDEADFAYLVPARWRVRHSSGKELIVDGGSVWHRVQRSSEWTYESAAHGAGVHHTGYLRGMIFPALLPPLAHQASRVIREEVSGRNMRRLWVSFEEPVVGSIIVDLSYDRRLARIEGDEHGCKVEIELVVDYTSRPEPGLFRPTTPWSQE